MKPTASVAALTLTAGIAAAQPLLGGSLLPNQIVDINTATGSSTPILNVAQQPQGLAYDADGDRLFGIDAGSDTIYEINKSNGSTTLVASLPSDNANGLAWNPNLGLIYASDNNDNILYSADPATGAVTAIGVMTGASEVEGLAYDPNTDTLYGLSALTGWIVTLDHNGNGAATNRLELPPATLWRGLAIDAAHNILYATTVNQGTLYRVDLNSDITTNVGPTTQRFIQGLAFVPEDCRPDINEDGSVNTQDFLAFLNAWVAQDPIADWDQNNTVNTQDVLAFLNDWVAGC